MISTKNAAFTDESDYRQIAPDVWLPFRQTMRSFDIYRAKPVATMTHVQTVESVVRNGRIDDAVFAVELQEGVKVATDWRYEPWISYTYKKDQTEEERIKLRDEKVAAERAKNGNAVKPVAEGFN